MTAPNIAVAVDAVQELVRGYDDVRALVLALVEHMPPEGVAELLARLIEGHPEGAGLVRVLVASRGQVRAVRGQEEVVAVSLYGRQHGRYRMTQADRWWVGRSSPRVDQLCRTEVDAEAALIAAQPVPAAVVRVRS